MSPWPRIALTMVAFLVLSSCTAGGVESLTNAELQVMFGDDFAARAERRKELVLECGTANGLNEDVLLDYIGPDFDTAAGQARQRATLAVFGSNLVARLAPKDEPLQLDLGLPPEVARLFDVGPIVNPVTGAQSQWGCETWILGQLNGFESPAVLGSDTYRSYGKLMEDQFEGHPEIVAIDKEYVVCMSAAGYPGLDRMSGHFEQLMDLSREVQSGESEFQAALDYDVAISLANFDCVHEIDALGRRERVADEIANSFAEEFLD